MHQGPISIVPTPSTISFSLTTPSHYPFSDVEYNSTHLGNPSSLSPSPKSFPLHQENSHRIQKLTSKYQSVQKSSSPSGELGEYDDTSFPSILSNHPYISSPQKTIARAPTSAENYRTAPLDEGAYDSHGFIQGRHTGHHDHPHSSEADTNSRQQETSSPFSSPPSISHHTPDPLILVYSRRPSKSKFNTTTKLDSLNTPQPKDSHTLDYDTTPPRRLRPLSDIYQELDNLECHFSDLDNGPTPNIDQDSPHTDLEEPPNVEEALRSPNADHWINAMKNEMQSLTINKTWDLVRKPTDRKIITCKWVL